MKRRHRLHFRLVTIGQVLLLTLTMLAFAWSALQTDHVAVPVVIAIVILLQVLGLVHSVESHVEALEEFLAAINYEDFTRRFIEGDVDGELKVAFNRILSRFQEARADREVQAGYLETVVRHVPVPFIAARQDGTLSLVNNPARRLTGIPTLRKLDQLQALDPELPARLQRIGPGQQQLLQTRIREVPAELRVAVSEIRLPTGVERLYSIENLSGELTTRETNAWRNLIRVLTHEIMNTLTPVTSLAQTTSTMLGKPDAEADVRNAIETIARRSEGLMSFVSRYRELLQIPTPNPATVSVATLIDGVLSLLQDQLSDVSVAVDVAPETLEVQADAQLLDQVLLNLVKNALDAMHDRASPSLTLQAFPDFGRVIIKLTDNGPGIDPADLEQVFVPFFTTKRDGSGIGLSLCRQIMSAHGGAISIQSDASGTIVTLVL